MNIHEKIEKFNHLQKKEDLTHKEKQELNDLAEEFLEITKQTYDKTAMVYSNVNETRNLSNDTKRLDLLFETAEKVLNKSISEMSVLDVGTGSGRDIKYIANRGVEKIIGLDNSEGFIKILSKLEKEEKFQKIVLLKEIC